MYYWSVQIKKSGIKIRNMDVEFEKDTEEGKKKKMQQGESHLSTESTFIIVLFAFI